MDMSLDEYIQQNDFKKPFCKKECSNENLSSKFDRYDRDATNGGFDEDDIDDMMDVAMEMPQLVPINSRQRQQHQQQQQQQQQRRPVHDRLGRRDSVTSSITDADSIIVQVNNTVRSGRKRQNNLKRLNNQNNGRISVQHRLNKNFVNPAIVARNNFSVNAINSFMESAMKKYGSNDANDGLLGQNDNFMATLATRLLSTFNQNKIEPMEQPKYNMTVQKEISAIQGKQFSFTCPGAAVVSSDGPGLQNPVTVPQNHTSMSLNQRFA